MQAPLSKRAYNKKKKKNERKAREILCVFIYAAINNKRRKETENT